MVSKLEVIEVQDVFFFFLNRQSGFEFQILAFMSFNTFWVMRKYG